MRLLKRPALHVILRVTCVSRKVSVFRTTLDGHGDLLAEVMADVPTPANLLPGFSPAITTGPQCPGGLESMRHKSGVSETDHWCL